MEFRLDFEAPSTRRVRIYTSADQQYILWLDGKYLGRGCELKSPESWFFETYDLDLTSGRHRLEVLVWNYGKLSPDNRMSVIPGFILVPEPAHTNLLGTGIAGWRCRIHDGIRFDPVPKNLGAYITVPPCEVRQCDRFSDDGNGSEWHAAEVVAPGVNGSLRTDATAHCLVPSSTANLICSEIDPGEVVFVGGEGKPTGFVPEANPDREALEDWRQLNQKDIIIPKETVARVIFRLDDYYCGYAQIRVEAGRGAKIRVTWAEAAFTDPTVASKSDRSSVKGKYFRGVWDEFHLDGGTHELSPLAWRSGQFVELLVHAPDEELVIKGFKILESRYPSEPVEPFSCDNGSINRIIPLCVRTLQTSSHEHFVDCPYYEQLAYTGDGRLEALVNLTAFPDDRLVRKMLTAFAKSMDLSGYTMSSWPRTVRAIIPSFSLSWVGMIYDYAMRRRDLSLIASLMPSVRFLLDHVLREKTDDGYLRGSDTGWNFIDWVDEWEQKKCYHVPPGMDDGVNSTYNWYAVYILGLAQKLEMYAGDSCVAARWEKVGDDLASNLKARFWCPDRGLFQEDDSGEHFSQHSQVAAVLSGKLDGAQLDALRDSLFRQKKLAPCSIYWRHYFFEACKVLGRPEEILSGLKLWNQFVENGFRTVPETAENKTFNQRSDCHGWGSHPIYHLITTIAGIEPNEMEFARVLINPRMAGLSQIRASCFHPDGAIRVEYRNDRELLRCKIELPEGLDGEFRFGDFRSELHSGLQELTIPNSQRAIEFAQREA